MPGGATGVGSDGKEALASRVVGLGAGIQNYRPVHRAVRISVLRVGVYVVADHYGLETDHLGDDGVSVNSRIYKHNNFRKPFKN